MTDIINVTITAPDPDWLRNFTRTLVEQRLAASGNITTSAQSVYRWNGDVHEATEAIVSLRTQARHLAAIVEATKNAPPYEVPHVVAVPILGANSDYCEWVISETGGPEPQ